MERLPRWTGRGGGGGIGACGCSARSPRPIATSGPRKREEGP